MIADARDDASAMAQGRMATRRGLGLLAIGAVSGVLVGLSVPPFGWWPAGWAGYGLLVLLLPGRRVAQRSALGFGAGVGQFAIGLWWVQEFSIPGMIGLIILSGIYVSVAMMLVPASRRRGVVFGLPAAIVLSEWLRDRFPLGGFPLGGSALGQASSPLAPTLRLGGSLLLVGVTVLVGVVLAELIQAGREWRAATQSSTASLAGPWRARLWGRQLALAAVVVIVPVLGIVSPNGAGGTLSSLRVALVQGGGSRGTRAIYTNPQTVFDRHLTASAVLAPPLDLVVWPEGVLQSHLPFEQGEDAADMSALAQRLGATVVAGVEQDVGVRRYLNETVAWSPSGQIVATYEKNHLVPFGEYVPWRSFLSKFFNFKDVPYDGVAGHSPGVMHTPAGTLGVMISYEVFFDERARGAVRAGGQILIVPTNTASYRSTQVPAQEVAAAKLRAWETGRWLLQVTPTGYTAVVSPDGRVVDRTDLDKQQVILMTVPRRTGRTVYVDLGDWPVATGALLLLVLGWRLTRGRFAPFSS